MDCSECKRKGETRIRGCYDNKDPRKDDEFKLRFSDMDGSYIEQCPKCFLLESNWIFNICNWSVLVYDRGMLPCSGGLLDQSASFVDAIQIAESLMSNGNEYNGK